MKYVDFVNQSYTPKPTDLLCDFYVEPEGITLKEAAGGVAAESSVGTWTELTTIKPYVEKLAATVFKIEGNNIRIAYPIELFEKGNMPNILSSVAGNVFGLRALKNLRLNDISLPKDLVQSFKGPKHGIDGIRNLLGVNDRPLVGTIIKPKLGLKTKDHAEIAFNAWIGGCDVVKDDENLSSQSFNPFEDRVVKTLEMRDRAESETGEKKVYMINITSETQEMLKRAQFVKDHGGRYLMVDILTCGFSALQTIRDHDFGLVIHAHRAGHSAFTKNTKHGISMQVIAKVTRIIGVDQLHVGTVVGKMSETKEEVAENCEALKTDMHGLNNVLPVASGGLYPSLVPALIKFFGKDFVIQAGGGIHGHPKGTVSGAVALRQAVDATLQGISLKDYAKAHKELQLALDIWE
ncbi:MAG: type III ribulose-bisphosphate carboxylase [Candidatus Bathyarchaeota archaeon]|nr:type III ribulose-bisphosphate carboxylase [Candidatus Bathyarchaeum tardum]WGM89231.1 MAG: type III ribulose-bisphosphate carboxylase [Candidatus Bathyarchaeum tardum]WNZ28531.1 MAG: type III ribulose-bisphosphate carboxylase [Candidatus Bathyarchaeota archaeon]